MNRRYERIDAGAQRPQLVALEVLALLYAALAAFWVPPHDRLLLPAGIAAMPAAGLLARRLGPARATHVEPPLVWAALFMLIVVWPVAGSPAPRGRGFAVGFLGVFCALGLWAVFRYPAWPARAARRSLAADLRWGVKAGIAFAAVCSLLALSGNLAARLIGEHFRVRWILLAYWGAGLAVGALAGLCRRLARMPLGSMLLGIPAAAAVYGAATAAMLLSASERTHGPSLTGRLLLALGIGVAAGPMLGLAFRNDDGW